MDKAKKILERPFYASLVVPVAVVLVATLIIFGVTKMLTMEKDHRDLINEMHSKTFGNRWVAAYELSKILAAKKIPNEDIPWLVENLSNIYKNSDDPRTRNFVIMALGSQNSALSLDTLALALKDDDDKVRFNAVVAIGNMTPTPENFQWEKLLELVNAEDAGVAQAVMLTLSQHKIKKAQTSIASNLTNSNLNIRFAAATALIYFKDERAIEVIKQIFSLGKDFNNHTFNEVQVQALKLNVLRALKKIEWNILHDLVRDIANTDKDNRVSLEARELLNILKKH